MTDVPTSREAFAGVLAGLVLARCRAANASRISRDELQASVPLNERPYVRRGLDALVEHGVLFQSEDDIGFTEEGEAFLAFVQRTQPAGEAATPSSHDDAGVMPLRVLMAQDARLVPPKAIEDIETLPGRLEEYKARRSGGLWNRWTLVFALGVAACAAFLLR